MNTKTQKFMRVFLVAISAICFAAGIAFMGNVSKPVALADEVEESDFGETTYNVSKTGEHMLLITPLTTDIADIYEVGYVFTGENVPDVSDLEKCATDKYYTSLKFGDDDPLTAADIFKNEDYDDDTPMIIWEVPRDDTKVYTYKAYYKKGTRIDDVLYAKNSDVPQYNDEKTTPLFFTITIDEDGGSTVEDLYVPDGTKLNLLNDVLTTKTGYHYNDWESKDGEDWEEIDLENDTVTADVTVRPAWEINTYTITWKNYDGTIIGTDTVNHGATPAYSGDTPTKAADAQYTYTHNGWSPAIAAATTDAEYTATYGSTLNSYTITWNNYDGTTLDTDTVNYGATPAYSGDTPTKAADAQYTYTFSAWTPTVVAVTGDATYTANYSPTINVYTITWMDDDEIIDTDEFDYGTLIAYDGTLEKEGSTFLGWEDENGDRIADDATVTGDMTLTAVWGIGTPTTLYVANKADFLAMGSGYDAKEYPFITYVLTADLSFDHSDFTYNSSTDPDFMGLDGMPKTGYLVRDLNFVFDGQGHTITTNYQKTDDWNATGVTSGYTVIFREIGTNGTLKNLKVVATTDSGWGESSVTRWNRGLIDNCYISASHTYQYGWDAGVCFCNTAEIIYNYGTVSNCVFNLSAYHTGYLLQGTTNYAVRYTFEGGSIEDCVIIGNVSSQNMSSNNGTWGTADNSDDKRDDCYVFASIDNMMLSGVGGKYNTDGTITAGTYTEVKGLFNDAYWTAWGFSKFRYDDASVTLDIKNDGVNDYGSVLTYNEYTASTNDLSVFTFVSSNTSVATVSSDGEITAVGDGTATISVKLGDTVINSISVTVNVWSLVSTSEQFLAMTNGKYALINDIDFGGAAASIATFSGTLDGDGYAIKNFATKYIFLTNSGTIRNVQFVGSIVGDGTMGAGIITNNRGTVENVFADIDMDIPVSTDGLQSLSAGTIIHSNHDALVKNAVIHVTVKSMSAGSIHYPGAILDEMTTAPYWNADHINNVYIYLDDAAGITAATPQIYEGGWDAVDNWNTTIHAYRNYSDFVTAVSAAISSGSLPAAFTDFMAQAHRISVVSSAQVIVGNTLNLQSLVTYRLAAVNTTYAIVSGGAYATLSQEVLTGTASGVVRVSVTTPTETKYIDVTVITASFEYDDTSKELVIKTDGVNDYGSVRTYHEYSASTNNLSLFTFESSDTSVATVSSDGEITAVGDGTATISVKYEGNVINSIAVTVNVWNAVSTSEQFLAMTNGKYALVQDIDFSGAAACIATFSGTLDGNGYALKNFASKNLIANNNGIIRNVQIIGSIVGDGTMGAAIIGNNRGTIENVYAEIDMNIPAATDGWSSISAGTIIHWSHETGLVKNVVVHVTATQTLAGTFYPGAVLDFMGTSPYWDTNHINNVYIYVDNAAGVTAATPNNGQGNVAVDILNPTVHAFRNSADFMSYVTAAISSDSLPSAIFQIVDGEISLKNG